MPQGSLVVLMTLSDPIIDIPPLTSDDLDPDVAGSATFADLGLCDEIVVALAARGITVPFPIQVLAIPDALAGRDVCGKAKTGSGKTLAFGLPVLQRMPRAGPGSPTGLVLAPHARAGQPDL